MTKGNCADCGKDISHRGWMAKRCKECSRKRILGLQKKYREEHKDEIKEYQKEYYSEK